MSKKPILIAHRGCINGPNKHENSPNFIQQALNHGFDVEIDVWYCENPYGIIIHNEGRIIDKFFYLGHDKPQYQIEEKFLQNKKLWCHAKDLVTFERLLQNKKIHSFFHEKDQCCLTSRGYIWCYPGKFIQNSIIGLPELEDKINNAYDLNSDVVGVYSDFIGRYK